MLTCHLAFISNYHHRSSQKQESMRGSEAGLEGLLVMACDAVVRLLFVQVLGASLFFCFMSALMTTPAR